MFTLALLYTVLATLAATQNSDIVITYVSTTGADATECGPETSPCRSLSHVLAPQVPTIDRSISIYPGIYEEADLSVKSMLVAIGGIGEDRTTIHMAAGTGSALFDVSVASLNLTNVFMNVSWTPDHQKPAIIADAAFINLNSTYIVAQTTMDFLVTPFVATVPMVRGTNVSVTMNSSVLLETVRKAAIESTDEAVACAWSHGFLDLFFSTAKMLNCTFMGMDYGVLLFDQSFVSMINISIFTNAPATHFPNRYRSIKCIDGNVTGHGVSPSEGFDTERCSVFFAEPHFPDTPGNTTDPIFPGNTTDPIFPGNTTDPFFPDNTTDPIFPGNTTDPVFPGNTTDPFYPGNTTDPSQNGTTTTTTDIQKSSQTSSSSSSGMIIIAVAAVVGVVVICVAVVVGVVAIVIVRRRYPSPAQQPTPQAERGSLSAAPMHKLKEQGLKETEMV